MYLHAFDKAHHQQKEYVGQLTRYADDFIIQCGTEEHAQRGMKWVKEQLEQLGLKLNAQKSRVVNDREEGFNFLGFYHRRVLLRSGSIARGKTTCDSQASGSKSPGSTRSSRRGSQAIKEWRRLGGEPCEGEPHARFGEGPLETEGEGRSYRTPYVGTVSKEREMD